MKRIIVLMAILACLFAWSGCAESPRSMASSAAPGGGHSYLDSSTFGMKIYAVNEAFYPFVMVYFRTADANQEPLLNLSSLNVGLMVKGRTYDPYKKQYNVHSLLRRNEGFRTVIVLDCSASMEGQPFRDAISACISYIRLKKPSDEIAIIALTNTVVDVCPFTSDANRLQVLLRDLKPIGERTLLYDGIGRALAACQSAAGTSYGKDTGFIVQSNILVITDANDEESSLTKDNLVNKLMSMSPPHPIYALAYMKSPTFKMKDLAAICNASFGRMFPVKSTSAFGRICDKVQSINRHDYVLTFRSYLPVDGQSYDLRLLLNYEGKAATDRTTFQTMQVPMMNSYMRNIYQRLQAQFAPLPDGNPYMGSVGASMPKPPVANIPAKASKKSSPQPNLPSRQ